MAHILATQRVVARNVGFGFLAHGQSLRRIDQRHSSLFAIDHASINLTMDTYSHLFPRGDDYDELAAAAMKLLS